MPLSSGPYTPYSECRIIAPIRRWRGQPARVGILQPLCLFIGPLICRYLILSNDHLGPPKACRSPFRRMIVGVRFLGNF
jgi:hypothetical protein